MSMPAPAQRLELVRKAGRAPSPHNVQPARWRFTDAEVQLFEHAARWLSVGDPSGRDNRVSLGMAWEGMSLALSELGFSLGTPATADLTYPPATQSRLVATAAPNAGVVADVLASQLDVRCSYRGVFASADTATRGIIEQCVARHAHSLTLLSYGASVRIAQWYDEAAAEGLRAPAFAEELYRWMRFSARDPNWSRDGLSAPCLALSPAQALAASWALRPGIVRVLTALGLGRALVSEAAKVKSAAAIVLVHAAGTITDFDAGRAWYRFWLELARERIVGVPMSALIDSARHARRVLDSCPIPHDHRLIGCMRLGRAPNVAIARSARLPPSELLL